jgi:hypothetical protein
MHDHELDDHDFDGCCKDCQHSLEIIKPHVLAFAERIEAYSLERLRALSPEELFQLFHILDDLAHLETGPHLAGLVLKEPDIRTKIPVIRSHYSMFFNIHEEQWANELLKSHVAWETLTSCPLYPRYQTLIRNQIEAVHVAPYQTVAFVGCGPVPISLILMAHLYGIQSVGLDQSFKAVELSRRVVRCLGMGEHIGIVHGDHSHLKKLDWDMVLISALAEPKARIFHTLRDTLKERGRAPVIYRTYTGMRAVLYEPVQPDDIEGFEIVKEIHPTGRVNNTIVFAELRE